MIIATSESLPGQRVKEVLRLAKGNSTRAKHVGKDFIAGLRHIVGGEIREYTEMMTEAREEALRRMVGHAQELGADAVIAARFTTSMVMQGVAEILAYGTAVKLEDETS